MSAANQRSISIVSAGMRSDGSPAFALTEVIVTDEEAENGIQYYLVEAELLKRGFEEPFVHFPAQESPAFLHDAVRQHLDLPPAVAEPIIHASTEKSTCLASSK
ncbi:MAG: hypothetical protein EXR98_19845 [Gemmataceae bacterium]|nr:hypothetical protein [Gemmataceae bacterium]